MPVASFVELRDFCEMSCLPCLKSYFIEKYFNFASFFLVKTTKDLKKKKKPHISMLFMENMYIIHTYINKECLAGYCEKKTAKGLDISPFFFFFYYFLFILFFSTICFLLCKMTARPSWLGDRGGGRCRCCGPALLSVVRVSVGWCSFLSPASQDIWEQTSISLDTGLSYSSCCRRGITSSLWNPEESWGEAHR